MKISEQAWEKVSLLRSQKPWRPSKEVLARGRSLSQAVDENFGGGCLGDFLMQLFTKFGGMSVSYWLWLTRRGDPDIGKSAPGKRHNNLRTSVAAENIFRGAAFLRNAFQ